MIEDQESELKLGRVCPDVATRWKAVRQEVWNLVDRQIRVTDGLRTFSDQWALWGKGRLQDKVTRQWVICDKSLVVTHAMPGESFHQYGLALDSCFMGDDPFLAKMPATKANSLWNVYGECVKNQGMVWGGSWKGAKQDRPHCEMTYGLTHEQAQAIYQDHGLKGVWEKCSDALLCGRELL